MPFTESVCAGHERIGLPDAVSHSRTRPSQPPEASTCPEKSNATTLPPLCAFSWITKGDSLTGRGLQPTRASNMLTTKKTLQMSVI